MNHDLLFKNFAKHIQLDQAEKEAIVEALRFKKFRRKQFLLQEGDICKSQYFILKGAVRLYQATEDGKENVVQFAFEDWFVADLMSYFTQKPSEYNIDALEDTEALLIESVVLDELYLKIPKLERFFRIVFQNALITSQWRNTIMQKNAEERYAALQKRLPFLEQRISQQQIASYLGITRETLSRLRNNSLNG